MSSPRRRLSVIYQKGGVRFTSCPLCNSRFESRLFHSADAEEELQNLYRQHPCKIVATADVIQKSTISKPLGISNYLPANGIAEPLS